MPGAQVTCHCVPETRMSRKIDECQVMSPLGHVDRDSGNTKGANLASAWLTRWAGCGRRGWTTA